jgi:hypothetical protein
MKYLRYLALAVFTFVIGVAISPIRFYPEIFAYGLRGSSTSYRSSYFMQTSDSYVRYDCEQHASDAFAEQLSGAMTVYDSSPKINKQGVLIEQRTIALFHHAGADEYYVVLFWRDGKTLRSISSRSYTHVKDFEKQNF